MADINQMESVIEAAREGVEKVTAYDLATESPLLLTREGAPVDLRKFLPAFREAPFRKTGTVTVFDAGSFNRVIAENGDTGIPTIYLDRDLNEPKIVAVLNGHDAGGPGWGDFRVQIAFRKTPQWMKWTGIDGQFMDQTKFAEFVEDNLADVDSPPGADMMDIITRFQATSTTEFKRAVRLSSGQVQFVNSENIEARVGAGEFEVPDTIMLRLQPFLGSPVYAVPARFRFRLHSGKLSLGIKLERREDLMQKVLDTVIEKVVSAPGIPILEGIAPSSSVA